MNTPVANIQNTQRITTRWWLYTSYVGSILGGDVEKVAGIPTYFVTSLVFKFYPNETYNVDGKPVPRFIGVI